MDDINVHVGFNSDLNLIEVCAIQSRFSKKSFKIPKGKEEAPNQRTDNVMTKRKKDKHWSTKHYIESYFHLFLLFNFNNTLEQSSFKC